MELELTIGNRVVGIGYNWFDFRHRNRDRNCWGRYKWHEDGHGGDGGGIYLGPVFAWTGTARYERGT